MHFGKWDEKLLLISPDMLPLITKGVELTSISGDTVIVGRDAIDTDTRFGLLAYGFNVKTHEPLKTTECDCHDPANKIGVHYHTTTKEKQNGK